MTGLEMIKERIDEMDTAMIEGVCVDGYETEAQIQAYMNGVEYATETLKKEYGISDESMNGRIREELLEPRDYLERVTGKYICTKKDTCEEIETILCQYGYENLWSYCLSDVDEAKRNNKEIVLVELCDDDDYTKHYSRWFSYPQEDKREHFTCPKCGEKVYLDECNVDKWWDDEGNHRMLYICNCGYENYDLD